jgi:hypothetical protein
MAKEKGKKLSKQLNFQLFHLNYLIFTEICQDNLTGKSVKLCHRFGKFSVKPQPYF